MYESFYGFREEPFRLSPDSRLCFPHASYRKAKAYMQYALQRREGFVMVTGRPGTGKSTLINDLTEELRRERGLFAALSCTQIEADDLLRLVVLNFGLDGRTAQKSLLLHDLQGLLMRLYREGRRPLLIIDEAQDLPPRALEELRLLTNLQQNNQPLLQIFLVGQEELRDTVLAPGLEQLHQRIVAACHLLPLDAETTGAYIEHRLRHVGWTDNPTLDPAVYPLIAHYSQGVPRLINLICSRLLLHGMVEERHALNTDDLRQAIDGLSEEQLLPLNRTAR